MPLISSNQAKETTANATKIAAEALKLALESIVKSEDSAHVSGDKGVMMLALRSDGDTSTADDGDYTVPKLDEEGRLKVATKPASFTLVTGAITANAQTVSADVRRASNVQFHVVATTLVGHNATFEGSIDSTNGTDGNWFTIQAVRSNANTIETATGVLAATPAYAWEASVNGLSFVRVRATAHTSGTATWKFQRGSYATEPIPAAQISGTQPISGTVTANITHPTTTVLAYSLNSAATTNLGNIKTSAGSLYAINAFNNHATNTAYVKLYNKASAPVLALDIPVLVIPVPPNSMATPISFGVVGHRFATGIGIAVTGGNADTDTTATAAGQVKVVTSFI